MGERHPGLFHGAVEGRREALIHAVLGGHVAGLVERGHEMHHAAVFGHHPFGSPGGSGGVDDIGELVRRRAGLGPGQPGVGFVGEVRRDPVEHHNCAAVRGHGLLGECLLGQDGRHGGVLKDEPDPLHRIDRIQRNVTRPCLEAGQHAQDRVDGPLEVDGHQIAAGHPQPAQMVRQLIRATVQLQVAQSLVLEGDRRSLRGPVDLGLEQIVQAQRVVTAGHHRVAGSGRCRGCPRSCGG